MMEITNEQWWKLYKTLPSELKGAVLSAENADHLFEVASRNQVEEVEIPQLATLVDSVLMGLLPPDEFQASLEKELGLERTLARKISQEINRFIFFPVKQSLAQLYQLPAAGEEKNQATPVSTTDILRPTTPEPSAETPRKPRTSKADSYREPIE